MKTKSSTFVAILAVQILLTNVYSKPSIPMLPYVFFEYNSAEIPSRYIHHGTPIVKDPVEANHFILNILGKRLRENPKTTLTLTGTNSNTDAEYNNTNLSRNRALAISNYLVKNWNINPKRLIIIERNLPEKPGNSFTRDGQEENRRVEISSNNPSILAPIL